MKFGNRVLCRAENVQGGDLVCFQLASANYRVEATANTMLGGVTHYHGGGTACSSYRPAQLLYVERANADLAET